MASPSRRDPRHIMQSQHAMPSADTLRGGTLSAEPRSYHASVAWKPPPLLPSSLCLFLHLFSMSDARGLPSGLCRSSWQAPFEAFHSCSSPQDCALLYWLCSNINSPPASLLPPSSFCSSPLSIYSCVRGGSVCACVCVWRREREREWVREEMEMMRVLSLKCSSLLTSTQRLDLLSRRICPL